MQDFLFDGRSFDQRIKEAEELLKEQGYRVLQPVQRASEITSPSKLVRYFYDVAYRYNSTITLVRAPSGYDVATAKKLVDSRRLTGVSDEVAYVECCDLIDTLFRYEKFLGLREPINSMRVLHNGRLDWIMDRMVSIYEKKNKEVADYLDERWFDSYNSKLENLSLSKKEAETQIEKLRRYAKKKEI